MTQDFTRSMRGLGRSKAPGSLAESVFARLQLGDAYANASTDIGDVYVAFGKTGATAVRRATSDRAFERWHRRMFGAMPLRKSDPDSVELARLRHHLADGRGADVRVDLRAATAFERAVLVKAREIPRGQVRPYSWIAREIGKPRAVRAVGSALARNPVPLLIPCHRVVRNDGSIGQYVFGSALKRTLLTLEGALPA